jgi:ubiquinone/menaquinone biosynthesis C-methylase UbiE
MSQPSDQPREYPHTYFVQDRSSSDERDRIHLQDIMVTRRMGGVLPEQTEPESLRRIMDAGCGTGNWLIETALTYPEIKLLVGIDVSKHIIDYAREQARAAGVDDRVEFHVMDTLQFIPFPQHYFDLVNQRLGWSYLRTWDWPNILTKYQYVTRHGGIIRITEGNTFDTSTSPALMQLYDLSFEAFYRAGHFFTPERQGVANKLPELFLNYGLKDVQTRTTQFEYQVGSEMMESFVKNTQLAFRTGLPFLRKWGNAPDNYQELCHQALEDIQQPACLTTGQLVTTWGRNP